MLFRLPARFFSTSSLLLKFRQTLTLHEYEATRMILPSTDLTPLAADSSSVQLAVGFSAQEKDIGFYRFKHAEMNKKETNTPRNSFLQIRLPLENNDELKNQYMRFKPGTIRVGKLLEALDFTAGFVSYYHTYNEPMSRTCTLVTLSVDNLQFFRPIRGDVDLTINAYPTYTGHSTIEIRTDLLQRDSSGEETLAGSSFFLMVARSVDRYQPYQVPKLIFEGENEVNKCLLREELAQIKQKRRKEEGGRSSSLPRSTQAQNVKGMPLKIGNFSSHYGREGFPSMEESRELHRIYMEMKEEATGRWCLMGETEKKKMSLMHMQDRNLHGKVFGGYLMRESIELAWLVAYNFCRFDNPEFENIDDFIFHKPVEIGSILDLEAVVTYAQGHVVFITVDAHKIQFKDGEEERIKCTSLHIKFRCPNMIMKKSYPSTYEEAMKYLKSKRVAELCPL